MHRVQHPPKLSTPTPTNAEPLVSAPKSSPIPPHGVWTLDRSPLGSWPQVSSCPPARLSVSSVLWAAGPRRCPFGCPGAQPQRPLLAASMSPKSPEHGTSWPTGQTAAIRVSRGSCVWPGSVSQHHAVQSRSSAAPGLGQALPYSHPPHRTHCHPRQEWLSHQETGPRGPAAWTSKGLPASVGNTSLPLHCSLGDCEP